MTIGDKYSLGAGYLKNHPSLHKPACQLWPPSRALLYVLQPRQGLLGDGTPIVELPPKEEYTGPFFIVR